MTEAKIAAFRLRRHHLDGKTAADPVTICRDICGAQAQHLPSAFLQIWARNRSITRATIEHALWESRTLVRTSLMRQTLHIIPADEFAMYIAALRTSRVAAVLRIMARLKITPEESDGLTERILDALKDGPQAQPAIRAAVRPHVSTRVRAWMDKVSSIVRVPVAEGRVCYGTGADKQVQFIRVDQWLPKQPSMTEAEAQAILLRKYLRTYGPATPQDFAYWSGFPAKECARVIESIKAELVEIPAHGMLLAEDIEALQSARAVAGLQLLPGFDPLLLGHRDKEHIVESRHYKRVFRDQWWISPVILKNGRIVGTWSYKQERGKCAVETDAWDKLPAKALAEQTAGAGAFL
jgi:hypothetical protein